MRVCAPNIDPNKGYSGLYRSASTYCSLGVHLVYVTVFNIFLCAIKYFHP
jgi:hypothetical protein